MTEIEQILEKCREEIEQLTGAEVKIWYSIKGKEVTPDYILNEVADILSVPKEKVLSKTRKRPFVVARQLYCLYAKRYVNTSLNSIAHFIGYKDHSTVIHACQVMSDLIDIKSGEIMQYVDELDKNLSTLNRVRA